MTIFYWCCSLFFVLEEAPNHSTDSPSSSRAIKGLSNKLHLIEHNKSAFVWLNIRKLLINFVRSGEDPSKRSHSQSDLYVTEAVMCCVIKQPPFWSHFSCYMETCTPTLWTQKSTLNCWSCFLVFWTTPKTLLHTVISIFVV